MSETAFDALPEELQLHVFEYLDSLPPSDVQARQEPSLQLVHRATRPLKAISRVSKRWRRITLPLLFKHACLHLDVAPRPEWTCSVCAPGTLPICGSESHHLGRIQQGHADIANAIKARVNTLSSPNPSVTSSADALACEYHRMDGAETTEWAIRFSHVLEDFVRFVQSQHLEASIYSFVLLTDRMLIGKLGRYPAHPSLGDWRYLAAASLWQHLLSVINPERVAIVAPPMDLACLTNASIDTFGDWAFSDMSFHTLELRQANHKSHRLTVPVAENKLTPFPHRHPGFAGSSVLHLRDWTHVSLNEGSFLKAYGTYEYFERGPPSIVSSIKQCFAPAGKTTGMYQLLSLRTFTYTAIFPFANHVDFADMLPHLEELDVQFAPNPQSGILDDKDRTGKAELQDCWQELISAYQDIAGPLSSFLMHQANYPTLKRFTSQDSKIKALHDDLDEIFTTLCLPVWAEIEPGVFTRLAMSPGLLSHDDRFS